MPINVGHDINGALAGILAYRAGAESGQAEKKQRASELALRQQQLNLQNTQAQADREHQIELAKLKHAQDLESMSTDSLNRIAAQRAGVEIDKEEYENRYTAQQKADIDKYKYALHQVETSEDYSPEEKTEARRRILSKMAGISPIPTPIEKSPFPPGKRVGETWSDESTGALVTRNPDNTIRKIADNPNVPTFRDIASLQEQAIKVLTRIGKDEEKILPSPQEVSEYVRQAILLRRQFSGMVGQGIQPGESPLAINGAGGESTINVQDAMAANSGNGGQTLSGAGAINLPPKPSSNSTSIQNKVVAPESVKSQLDTLAMSIQSEKDPGKKREKQAKLRALLSHLKAGK